MADKRAVIDRDTDLLTKEGFIKYAKEVRAGMPEELKTWIAHLCFKRRPRQGAKNILGVNWVAKWKWVKKKDSEEKVRVIRMRMTLRGFKDEDADYVITFAGAS